MNKKLLKLNSFKLKIDQVLGCDLFVKISETKAIVLFKKDTVISIEDLEIYKKYEQNYVYVQEEDFITLFNPDALRVTENLDVNEKIDTKVTENISRNFFKSEDIIESEDKLGSMVNMANNLIQQLLASAKNEKSQVINQILTAMKGEEDNPYVNHANQVTAISTMVGLMIEGITLDHVVEIAMGASMHAMGLACMVNDNDSTLFAKLADTTKFEMPGKTDLGVFGSIIEKHYMGHKKLTSSENLIYLKHLSFVEVNIDKIKIKNINSATLLKIIRDFKYIQSAMQSAPAKEENPYIVAKILAIGDKLVSLMTYYSKSPKMFEAAIKDITEINTTATRPPFDPRIVLKLQEIAAN